jgi:hypothetical protein
MLTEDVVQRAARIRFECMRRPEHRNTGFVLHETDLFVSAGEGVVGLTVDGNYSESVLRPPTIVAEHY